MTRGFRPCVLTANDLLDGDAVYLDPDGAWTRELAAARLLEDEVEAERCLAVAEARGDKIVGPYLADAAPDGQGAPRAAHYREAIRASGPSNYRHGKQAGS